MHKVSRLPCEKCYRYYRNKLRGPNADNCKCMAWNLWFALEWNKIQKEAGVECETTRDIYQKFKEKSQYRVYKKVFEEI